MGSEMCIRDRLSFHGVVKANGIAMRRICKYSKYMTTIQFGSILSASAQLRRLASAQLRRLGPPRRKARLMEHRSVDVFFSQSVKLELQV